MCGIAEIRETFTKSKIENKKSTKLGTVRQENEEQIHYTQTAISLFITFNFLQSGEVLLSSSFQSTKTMTLPMFNVLQSATSQQHAYREILFYFNFLLKCSCHAIGRLLCLLISLPTHHFTYLLKRYSSLYHKRKRWGKSRQLSLGPGKRD